MNQDFDKNKKSNGNILDAILIREVDNISNFNEDIQPDNIEEQIEIPQMEIEENQIDYNFVNNINLNNEEFQKDKIKDSYQNFNTPYNSNNIIHVDEGDTPNYYLNYLFKSYKKYFNKFLQRYEKELITKSDLPKKFKKYKLYSNISFTVNSKKSDNFIFLSFTLREILCYYKGGKSRAHFKKKNSKAINAILKFIESTGDEEKYKEIENFFKMKLEDAYELYEKSEEFKNYTLDDKVIFFDEKFKAKQGFSLLEKNGFVHAIRNFVI